MHLLGFNNLLLTKQVKSLQILLSADKSGRPTQSPSSNELVTLQSWQELYSLYQACMCNCLTKYSGLGISQNKPMQKFTILADGVRTARLHAVKSLIFPQLASFLWSE